MSETRGQDLLLVPLAFDEKDRVDTAAVVPRLRSPTHAFQCVLYF